MNYEVLGKMSGTLQIGAAVNDGESVALDKLAQWATQKVQVAVDSKVSIKRCLVADIHRKCADVWTTTADQRGLLQLSWTKGHLSQEQRGQRFGPGFS